MAQIKIIMSTTEKIGSKFLRWAQRCKYSHCEALLVDDMGHEYIIGARTCGVHKFDKNTVADNHEILTVDCTEEQYGKFHDFLCSKVGNKYDWRAYLGFFFNKKNHNENRWFCSELLAEAFRAADIVLFTNVKPWFCMPRDFYISPICKETGMRVS